tara:strand:+ start:6601 stop:6867 length:267 start_codon:yes stop_codon:yes gene_type:complete
MPLSSKQIEKIDSFRIIINSLWTELEDVKYDIELEVIQKQVKNHTDQIKVDSRKLNALDYIEKALNSLNDTEGYLTVITSPCTDTKIH